MACMLKAPVANQRGSASGIPQALVLQPFYLISSLVVLAQ